MFSVSSFIIGILSGVTGSMIALLVAAFILGRKIRKNRESLEAGSGGIK